MLKAWPGLFHWPHRRNLWVIILPGWQIKEQLNAKQGDSGTTGVRGRERSAWAGLIGKGPKEGVSLEQDHEWQAGSAQAGKKGAQAGSDVSGTSAVDRCPPHLPGASRAGTRALWDKCDCPAPAWLLRVFLAFSGPLSVLLTLPLPPSVK